MYVKTCPSGQRCKRKEDSKFGYCLPILTPQKEGESSVYDFESEDGKCKDSKCQGFPAGTPCSRDADCNYETCCSKTERVCKKIIEKDQPYEMSFDRGNFDSCFSYCELGYLCRKVGTILNLNVIKHFHMVKVILLIMIIYVNQVLLKTVRVCL